LIVIELQTGSYFGEDGMERINPDDLQRNYEN